MLKTVESTTTKPWANAIAQTAVEFGPIALSALSGTVPEGLRGALYRNGPAMLEQGKQLVGHWFDGDGGILALHFADGRVTGQYRYVQTAGYLAEADAGKFLLGGYGMLPPGRLWQRFGKDLKNVANTSVLVLPDRLLALWEGGLPHALTLDTLETLGLDSLEGLANLPYSAHPKRDPSTGDIFNFGVSFGANGTLNLYRSDSTGKIQQKGAIALRGLPLIHDFVLAGRYLIFCVPPVRLNALPVLAQLKSYSDALLWQPEKGTEILVIDRETLQLVSRIEAAPWYQWHFGNGYELPDGSVVLDVARYADFQINQRLQEVAMGQMHTAAEATLWQLRLEPNLGKLLEMQQVLHRSCEFPSIKPSEVGKPSRHTYLSIHSLGVDTRQELLGAIACFDHHTGTLTEASFGSNCYASEPIYAPDAQNPQQDWIITVVYNGSLHTSEVWIFASDRLEEPPVCRLALPHVVPHSFHGTWKPG